MGSRCTAACSACRSSTIGLLHTESEKAAWRIAKECRTTGRLTDDGRTGQRRTKTRPVCSRVATRLGVGNAGYAREPTIGMLNDDPCTRGAVADQHDWTRCVVGNVIANRTTEESAQPTLGGRADH